MQLLTIPAMTAPAADSCMSQGGLVDRQTAAAECVVLWTDPPRDAESVVRVRGRLPGVRDTPLRPARTWVAQRRPTAHARVRRRATTAERRRLRSPRQHTARRPRTEPAVPRTSSPPTETAIVERLRAAGCVFAEEEARLLISAAARPGSSRPWWSAGPGAIRWSTSSAGPSSADCESRSGAAYSCRVTAASCSSPRPSLAPAPGASSWTCAAAPERSAPPWHTLRRASFCTRRTSTRSRVALRAPQPRVLSVAASTAAISSRRSRVHLRGSVDVLVANVPYVPTADIAMLPREARDHEPRASLDGGEDGLDMLRRLAARATEWLRPGAHLLVETSDSAGRDCPLHRRGRRTGGTGRGR